MKRTTLTRSKPLAQKSTKKRTTKFRTPRCEVRGCKKKAEIMWFDGSNDTTARLAVDYALFNGHDTVPGFRRMCPSHAKAEADRRFSWFIRTRDGKCMIPNASPCVGGLQCCHILSRRFMGVRYDPQNAVAGCAGHHTYWTRNPDRWAAFIEDRPSLKAMRRLAFGDGGCDLGSVLSKYAPVPRND